MRKIIQKEILAALEDAHDGFLITDRWGRLLYFNKAYVSLTRLYDKCQIGLCMQQYIDEGILTRASCLEAVKQRKTVTIVHWANKTGATIISVSKPCFDSKGRIEHVLTNIRDITELFDLRSQMDEVQKMLSNFSEKVGGAEEDGLIAVSPNMRNVINMAQKIAAVDATVLIQGESGTGKDMLAHYIHQHSQRSGGPFMPINCGAIPESLMESELFGYSKGTFTGQQKGGKPGLLKATDGGTLFLDEIVDMPLHLQVKLLRFLETRAFMPVGGTQSVHTDVRVLAATNQDIKHAVDHGTFREDLYYRLNVIHLNLPALRERPEDVAPLSLYFLKLYCEKYKIKKRLTPGVIRRLIAYPWPGNVRELRNVIERMTIMSSWQELELPPEFEAGEGEEDSVAVSTINEDVIMPLEQFLNQKEKDYLSRVYYQYHSTRKTAEVLGIDHSTIVRKLKKYDIHPIKQEVSPPLND